MAQAAPFIMMAATAMKAIGTANQLRGEARASKQNAELADQQALISRQQADADAVLQQRRARKVIGNMRANYGASGLTMEGSPLDVLEESVSNAEMDRQTILYRGNLRAMGFENTAAQYRARAKNMRNAAYLTLLTGFAEAGGQGAQSGVFDSKPDSDPLRGFDPGPATYPSRTYEPFGGV
ncbi:MAG: hypothetical protein KG075_09550 [Alphaproteobacteria bacterium]|nr:hypothetical protein [Alphaproteobacteria bacterium]